MLSRQYSSLPSSNDELDGILEGDDNESEFRDAPHCITCGKDFKTKKQLSTHEQSKKHKESVALIEDEMKGSNREETASEKEESEKKKNGNVFADLSSNPLFLNITRCLPSSISSYSLPDQATLKTMENSLEREREPNAKEKEHENAMFEELPRNNSQPNINSLLYLKLKGINRRCSLPEKKKNKNYSKFEDEDENCEETDSENLLPNDSMGLFRTKTKKQEIKDSADRVRKKSNGTLNAALGNSCITDSMSIHKKRASSAGSKLRKKVFGKTQ